MNPKKRNIILESEYMERILIGIKEYFEDIGYEVEWINLSQAKEKFIPVDKVLAIGNKFVGLQFKRPLYKNKPYEYDITPHQHEGLLKARWAFYCFPDFTDLKLRKVAIHHCKFLLAEKVNKKPEFYYRWGSFVSAFIECKEGIEIEGKNIEKLREYMIDNPKKAFISLNKEAERIYLSRPDVKMESEPA